MIQPAKAKILVVEDLNEMRDILRRLLGVLGFANVSTVTNGAEAWEQLNIHNFDLVLCDWNMPKMSGRELLEKVRSTPALHHLPFIMITGENASDMVRNAIAGGVTDFIVKPFTGALLEHRVKQALEHARPAPKVM
ncbi:response regulator [Rhodoferax sp. AJA081-3]|uniref:response regulator n=1 Tax=Rhodoferax sp. AJA081-3 TaxID=2752316 RepID=UPI001ADEC3E2|nr:response regulator [Rhodoferax sp. AJA081-3]QTN28389.1 response regulator [Rhodoferax sp. AJA081-3]